MSYFTKYEPMTAEELKPLENVYSPPLVARLMATIKARDEEIAVTQQRADSPFRFMDHMFRRAPRAAK